MCFHSYSFDQDLPTDQDMPRVVHPNADVHPAAAEVMDLTCDNKIKDDSNCKVQVYLQSYISLGKLEYQHFQ